MRDRAFALYGRFSPGVRDQLRRKIVRGGGLVARDLTRRSDAFVVGALATTLIDSGALGERLVSACERGVRVRGERAFLATLSGEGAASAVSMPIGTALAQSKLARDDAELLAAFDLVEIEDQHCRFGDVGVMRTAVELLGQGRSRADTVRILMRARDLAPIGLHKIVLTASGEAALQWSHGLTSLEGQGLLPLDEDHPSVDDLFEHASLAEAEGDLDEAARLFDLCARADRKDPIAPYNLANIRLAQGEFDQAALAYHRALSRDPAFIEARYNLAQALEAAGKTEAAVEELNRVLKADPGNSDAVFNLAQLRMRADETGAAKALFERYLALDPPDEWAAKARKAIAYCSSRLSA
ncbi:MAG TPA: tetratricopeptide repeat protein [Caulobacteraceae bacterium]